MNHDLLTALNEGATVVTGNNRLARQLSLEYSRAKRAEKLNAWQTPDVMPWGVFLTQLWNEARLNSQPSAETAESLLNQHQSRLLWESVIDRSGAITVTARPAALARLASRSWRLMQQWQISLPQLQQTAYSPDQKAFVNWASLFRQELEQGSWLTEDELPSALMGLSGAGPLLSGRRLYFAGFDEFNPSQTALLEFFEANGAECSVVSHAERLASCQRIEYPDETTELEAAARWARACADANPDQSIAVLIPDLQKRAATVRRVFLDVLVPDWRVADGRYRLPVNFSYGEPLSENGVVSTALRLLSLGCSRIGFADASLLLRSHYVGSAGQEEWQRASAELELREAGIVEVSAKDLAKLTGDSAPLFAGILNTLPDWRAKARLKVWSAEFAALLKGAGWPGAHLPETSEYQAYQSWTGLLDDLAGCDAMAGEVSASRALGILRAMAQEKLFQAEGNPDAIQVMGLLEASGQQFDHLRVCGLTTDAWPAAAQSDPLLPQTLQRELRMPNSTPDETWRFNKAVMTATLNSAVEPVVTWPRYRNEEELYPAPLPAAISDSVAPEVDDETGFAAAIAAALTTTELADDVPPPVPEDERVYGGSGLLAKQAACPARAFIEYRLHAKELRKAVSGIDPMTRGTLMHRALELWYRRYPKQSMLLNMSDEQLNTELRGVISEAINERFGGEKGVLGIVAGQEVDRLQRVILRFFEVEKRRSAFEVTGWEEERQELIGDRMELYLKLDRIDELEGGERIVIDYKSGTVPGKRWEPPRPLEPQLPVYAVTNVAQGIAIATVSADRSKLGIRGISDAETGLKTFQTVEKYKYSEADDWAGLVAEWRQSFDLLSKEFMGGDFRLNTDDLANARGEFGLVIRTAEFIGAGADEDFAQHGEADL